MNNLHKINAQLLLGNPLAVTTQVLTDLKKFFCAQNGCNLCTICRQIHNRQHHAIRWLAPEKQYYTVAQLEAVFHELSFALGADESFFFIFEHADLLSVTCANSLLKSLEEPPPGYHFILLAQRVDMILPTIKSRCVLQNITTQAAIPEYAFLELFKQPASKKIALSLFAKEFEKVKISENETRSLRDNLLEYWITQKKVALTTEDTSGVQHAQHTINYILQSFEQLPMPGSVKLFWRNLFLLLQS